MKAVVLFSASSHPVSGKPAPARAELQAVALAHASGFTVTGLAAGPDISPAPLGHGLYALKHVKTNGDAVEALVAALATALPDIMLCGPRAEGQDDTGMVPYLLAERLGLTLVADAVSIEELGDGMLEVIQGLPRGQRRRVVVKPPLIATVHAAAPAPLPFVWSQARSGTIETVEVTAVPAPASDAETRPFRPRGKLMEKAGTDSEKGKLLVNPAPQDAAREVISWLKGLGRL